MAHSPAAPTAVRVVAHDASCTLSRTTVPVGRVRFITLPTLTSVGVDGRGRVYVTAAHGGVYRLDPA